MPTAKALGGTCAGRLQELATWFFLPESPLAVKEGAGIEWLLAL